MSRVQQQVCASTEAKHRNNCTLSGHPACLSSLDTRLNATPPLTLQAKLEVGRSDDPLEREADQVANLVMRMPEPRLQRKADKVAEPMQAKPLVQRRVSSSKPALAEAPPIVHEVLRSPGRSLEPSTRRSMEARFGHDFSRVRVHTDGKAAASAQAVNARAYTVGRDLVFGPGEYAPNSREGQQLLVHELVHVVQQDGFAAENLQLMRFVRRERTEIGDLDEAVGTASRVANDRGVLGLMRWGRFTAAMGGSGALEAVRPQSGSTAHTPFPRYIYTCRCGLIDLRHFYQLMYIALLLGEETAVTEGVKHERIAEPSSAFAPEDITSNALGAEFGSQLSWLQRQSTFVSALRSFLNQCSPVQWHRTTVTPTQRDCVVDFYAVDASGGSHRRRTAGSTEDSCGICSGTTSFPFQTDEDTGTRIL